MALAWYLQLNWNSAPSIAAEEKDSRRVSLFFSFFVPTTGQTDFSIRKVYEVSTY